MENGDYVQGSVWFYAPNKGAPLVFAILFLTSGAGHFWQCYKYRSWHITWFLPLAAIMFLAGFILREVGAFKYGSVQMFVSSTVILHMSPPIYQFCNAVILSRILSYIPYNAPINPGRLIKDFWIFFCFIESITGNGASQAANSSTDPYSIFVGKALLKTSLVVQLAGMVYLVCATARWHWNCNRDGKLNKASRVATRNIKKVLITLYCSCALIIVRTIYRIVECFKSAPFTAPAPGAPFEPSSFSPVIRYEWFFWIFEATLMLCNIVIWTLRNPAQDLPDDATIYLAEDGIEREGAVWQDRRRFWVKLIDPFDIGRIARKDNQRWWDPTYNGNGGSVKRHQGSDIALLRV